MIRLFWQKKTEDRIRDYERFRPFVVLTRAHRDYIRTVVVFSPNYSKSPHQTVYVRDCLSSHQHWETREE